MGRERRRACARLRREGERVGKVFVAYMMSSALRVASAGVKKVRNYSIQRDARGCWPRNHHHQRMEVGVDSKQLMHMARELKLIKGPPAGSLEGHGHDGNR